MKHIESYEQRDVISWARIASRQYPELEWLHSSLNGVKVNSIRQAQILKAEGMKSGICDLFLPLPKWTFNDSGDKIMQYAGLYIEMKKPKTASSAKGSLSQSQKDFIEYANSVGYKASVAYGAREAIQIIKDYLNLPSALIIRKEKK